MSGTGKPKDEKKSTLSTKVANMAAAAANNDLALMLADEMEKQREHLEDMASLIQLSLAPIQSWGTRCLQRRLNWIERIEL